MSERQPRVLDEADAILSRQSRKEHRLKQFNTAAKIAAAAAVIVSAEWAIVSNLPKTKQEPSCLASPFQIDCRWDIPTPTHTPVPEHEIKPNVQQNVR